MDERGVARKEFVLEVSKLIDDFSGRDFKLMRKLEDFSWNILKLIDGCNPDKQQLFLSTCAREDTIISGCLHHDIIKCRLFKNPDRYKDVRPAIIKELARIKSDGEFYQKSSSSSLS